MQDARINQRIKASEVRVIDQNGKSLGVMPLSNALEMAQGSGLDVVEVQPLAKPPVVKLLSYDKFRYQQEKAQRAQKKRQKKIEVKGIRLSIRIGAHDLAFKTVQADKFLGKGNKVKVELFLRGRERANVNFAYEVLQKFLKQVTVPNILEQHPKKLGNIISAIIAPKAQ